MNSNRIEFIDLAKGICILLVVVGHVGVNIAIPGLESVRMPLYFILSGLFFKSYGGVKNFLIKKINKILIPFLFFYLLGYSVFYVVNWIKPSLIVGAASSIFDMFTQRQYFNGPIWFLLALFWTNIMFCVIYECLSKEWLRAIAVLLIGVVGMFLGRNDIYLPCVVDSAMTALPFFYFGYWLKQSDLLSANRYDRYNWLWVLLLYGASVGLSRWSGCAHIGFHYNNVVGNVFVIYLLAVCSVMAVLLFCKIVKYLPFVSYCGRYSIILLCTHHLFYRPIKLVLMKLWFVPTEHVVWITAILTLLCCYISIPLCVKYIPCFTAQKDLIK